jgi:hypothetical protein
MKNSIMSDEIKIYADFQKADDEGRLILTCLGTLKDLNRYGVQLSEGLRLTFYSDDADENGNSDDLIVEGITHYDKASEQWTAIIDWNAIKHTSDFTKK